jgi:peptidoglycan/xylan/chitin deacetylase (PgdA/CDA1 family)
VTALERLAAVARRLPWRRPRALVLVYHRVGERGVDPWHLKVEPDVFAGQMATLARDWCALSLAELAEGLERDRLPERAVAVTFDDGYADNLEVAAPILLEQKIPATFFVTTGLVDGDRPPWWDELASLLLEPDRLPSTLTLSIADGQHWRIPPLGSDDQGSADAIPPWKARRGTRLRTFYEVWLALRDLDPPTREAALEEISDWSGQPRPTGRVMLTWDQLRELAALPGVELGAHTVTHPDLPNCSREEAHAQIADGAEQLRGRVGVEVDQFAYPFGNWNAGLARLVAELGFRAAYTTDGIPISRSSSAHALPRVPAEGDAPREFAGLLAALIGG